ncbi:hypothetical protein V6N11_030954 [Hibiscus sabdariffa]|uniref:Uncharacterized protein n=1 Tax=Hibiscus sabdariffa TaxID=183260 RepID=A0ABR2NS18_9ROSI
MQHLYESKYHSIKDMFCCSYVKDWLSVSRVSWAPDPRRPRANTHRLRHGLPGYLIFFAPHAFAPQRRRGFFLESCHDHILNERALRAGLALLHSRDITGPGFRPLSKIPHCCPPWEFGLCLSPSVADHPKRPAKHHWLGQPLPDQLPNTMQAHQTALFSFIQDLAPIVWQIPMRYAPVRNSSHALGRPEERITRAQLRATALTAARSYCMHGSDEVLIALFLGDHSFSRGSALMACLHRSTTRPMPCCSNGNKETNREEKLSYFPGSVPSGFGEE